MNEYQTLHLSYPVLGLTILSLILICCYFLLYSIKGKDLFLVHFGFLVLVTIENITENLFQPSQNFPTNLREATGYIISAFWPYYVYKFTGFPFYKRYVIHGLFIFIPTVFFFFAFYPFWGTFILSRKLVYIIPAGYGLISIPIFFKSTRDKYSRDRNKLLYYEYLCLMAAIILWALSPLVRIYLNGSRSLIGIAATAPIILFNVWLIIKELRHITKKTMVAAAPLVSDLSIYNLTTAEVKVVEMAYQEKTNKEIGKELFISEARVKQLVSSAYKKMGVKNKIGMIKKLKEEGLIPREVTAS